MLLKYYLLILVSPRVMFEDYYCRQSSRVHYSLRGILHHKAVYEVREEFLIVSIYSEANVQGIFLGWGSVAWQTPPL